ncbi:hypothetical protein OPQ81_001220 [Rhizoctonia solani]|nr:hypothetical protein OPQ81_001220 [Rhizoctonia solani]
MCRAGKATLNLFLGLERKFILWNAHIICNYSCGYTRWDLQRLVGINGYCDINDTSRLKLNSLTPPSVLHQLTYVIRFLAGTVE